MLGPSSRWGRAGLALVLNTAVVGPVLVIADLDPGPALLFMILVNAFAAFEAAGAEAVDHFDGRYPVAELATALATLALFWLAALTGEASPPGPLMLLGALVMVFGIGLRHVAMRTLGSAFITQVRPKTTLKREGVYSLVRHPSELGLLAITLGSALTLSSEPALLAWLIAFVPLTLHRIRAEDKELASRCPPRVGASSSRPCRGARAQPRPGGETGPRGPSGRCRPRR